MTSPSLVFSNLLQKYTILEMRAENEGRNKTGMLRELKEAPRNVTIWLFSSELPTKEIEYIGKKMYKIH